MPDHRRYGRAVRPRVQALTRHDDAAVLSAATAVVAAVMYWVVHRSLIDDAFITLVYARNVAFHFHWGLIPERTANSATSPLNVLVIAAMTSVVRNPLLALGFVYVGANALFA